MPVAGLPPCAHDAYAVITLRGELDAGTITGSVRILCAHADSGTRMIVNLAELAYVDCSSLRRFLSARDRAQRAGGDLALAGPLPAAGTDGRPRPVLLRLCGA
jgi:anti-anti-sigma factor